MHTRWIPALLAALALSACQLSPHTDRAAPFSALAQISSISPDTSEALRAGTPLKLRVGVSYALSADAGTLTLLVLSADSALLAREVRPITRGSGTALLEAGFAVPATSVVRVFTTLTVQGQDATSAVDGRSFEVTR